MLCQSVCFEIHVAIEYDKFLCQTVERLAKKVLVFKVLLQHVVILVVLVALFLGTSGFAKVTLLVTVAHVHKELIIPVKVLSAEFAVPVLHVNVSSQTRIRVQGMLVGKDALVLNAHIAASTRAFQSDAIVRAAWGRCILSTHHMARS